MSNFVTNINAEILYFHVPYRPLYLIHSAPQFEIDLACSLGTLVDRPKEPETLLL
jgi:hypothetical protein